MAGFWRLFLCRGVFVFLGALYLAWLDDLFAGEVPAEASEAVVRATTYGAFWYHPVYDRALQEADHPDEAGEPEGTSASAE